MGSSTGSMRRESTKLRRARASSVPEAKLRSDTVSEKSVRHARVADVKKKISSVDYDLDKDFRKAMHKLLEGFGA